MIKLTSSDNTQLYVAVIVVPPGSVAFVFVEINYMRWIVGILYTRFQDYYTTILPDYHATILQYQPTFVIVKFSLKI